MLLLLAWRSQVPNVASLVDNQGENYGWNIMEELHCFAPMEGCDPTGLTLPVAEYDHSQGDCAIIGGFVSRGPPRAQGR